MRFFYRLKNRTKFKNSGFKVLLCILISQVGINSTGKASITTIKALSQNYTSTQEVILFTSSSITVTVEGSFVDLTSSIKLAARDGQSPATITLNKSGNSAFGVNPAFVTFTVNTTATGRYRVTLERAGGSDVFNVVIKNKPLVNKIAPLTMAGAPAYLDAFAINTDFKIQVTGSFLSDLIFNTGGKTNTTIISEDAVARTAGAKNSVIRVTRENSAYTFLPIDFSVKIGTREIRLSNIIGVTGWSSTAFDFPVYDKADVTIVGPMKNLHKSLFSGTASSSCTINNRLAFNLPDPIRCVTTFAIPNPTQAAPISEKIVSLPKPTIQIKNNSFAPIFTPFRVEFKLGLTVLESVTVDRLIAKEIKTITFNRPESRKKLVRSVSCTECYEILDSPFDWQDVVMTVVVDAGNQIPENNTGEGNNAATFNP